MKKEKFLSICLNPVLQKTILLDSMHENEINRSNEYYFDVSGKGVNVSRVLHQLGQDVVHLTQCGGKNRKLFISMVKKDGINIKTANSNSEIRCCFTLLNREKKTTTEIIEEAVEVDKNTERNIYNKFLKLVKHIDLVIISGTKAAGFSDDIYPSMVRKAKLENKKVILDIKGQDLISSLKYNPEIIKPNYSEFAETFLSLNLKENDQNTEQINKVKEKMIQIRNKYKSQIIITRGKHSIIYLNNSGNISKIKPEIIDPVNTIGCGDAFTAGFASYYSSHLLVESINKGLECARKNALNIRPGNIVS